VIEEFKEFGSDEATHNIDRILRLPGTVNYPNKKKRVKGRVPTLAYVVEAHWERRITPVLPPLDLFDAVSSPGKKERAKGDANGHAKETSGEGPEEKGAEGGSSDWAKRIERLPQRLKDAIATGHTERSKKAKKGGDRSIAVFAVTCGLVRAGWSDDDIVALLLNPEFPMSEHCREQWAPRGYARKQVVAAREQVEATEGQTPIPLGYTKDDKFALLDRSRNIVLMYTKKELTSSATLLGLPSREYWCSRYWNPKSPTGFNSALAGNELIEACQKTGPFNPAKVRGRGVWREGDETVINLGLPVREGLKYRYVCFEPLPIADDDKVDAQRLFKLIETFRWRNPFDAHLFFGWIAIAPICGALGWRPHIWVTGPRNAGKSTLIDVLEATTSPLGLSVSGTSTEAHIRQEVDKDARPVILDNSKRTKTRRRSWPWRGFHRLAIRSAAARASVCRRVMLGS